MYTFIDLMIRRSVTFNVAGKFTLHNCKSQTGLIILMCIMILAGCLGGCSNEESHRLKIGDPAPDFVIRDLEGREHSLAEWKGAPGILRFWDTECKYCRADTPIFNSYFNRYKQRGLNVLYIAMGTETRPRVESFVSDLDIPFPVAIDSRMKMATDYQVRMVPQTIFISPDQKIITAVLGGVGEVELEEIVGKFMTK